MNGNKGLSKAYNAAIDYLVTQPSQESSLVVLLDDDTHIGNDYFEAMEKSASLNADIYLPVVLDQMGILSPSIMKKYRCRRCKNLKQLNEKNICGINSGMAIKESLFKGYRYNEKIFLDYVDHSFIRDMKELGKKVEVVDTTLQQNFSSITDSYEQTIKRFNIFKKDIRVFYSRGINDRLVYLYIILRRKLGIFLKFKNLSVFWKC
jgi:glycosyltransferase involved in cell wall biosynthesis